MGPIRDKSESLSSYRFRYALYSAVWLGSLGVPLVLVWGSRAELAGTLLGMFLLFGLSIGTGIALVAMLGFLIGGAFRQYAESSPRSAKLAERVKVTLLAIGIAPVGLGAVYVAGRGLLSQSVPALSRNSRALISYSDNPVAFGLLVTLWAAIGLSILVATAKRVRQAYAT